MEQIKDMLPALDAFIIVELKFRRDAQMRPPRKLPAQHSRRTVAEPG